MTLGEVFYVLRRWRSLVAAGVLIGLVVGWLSAPGAPSSATTFQATHTLLLDPQARRTSLIDQAAVRATLGAVPDRVAARLGIDGRLVRSMVSAEIPPNQGLLLVTGRSADPAQAEAVANVTAEELIVEFGGPNSPLRTLEPAMASPVESDDIVGPSSRPGRALLLGAFGLVLGLGAAFVVERLDNRIRSKRAAAEALGIAIVAEVPPISRLDRDRLVSHTEPSLFVEAYRGLRTFVDMWTPHPAKGNGGRVIVVTSPTAGEGKTVTVAHLATTMAEIGRSVLVISADLRHPRLHLYFDRAREPGLVDILRGAPDTRRLTDLNLVTPIPGVSFVASGTPVENPSALLDHIGVHLDAARALGDIVLVDSPPLLTTSDGADLARHADGVLLVLRAGRTSVAAATRSVELLDRLGIPVLGTVLVGTDGSGGTDPKSLGRPPRRT
jgi:capsular exopolysaccharide synthesis family protein